MSMPILLDHLTNIDKLKEKVETESEQLLKVINLKELLNLDRQQKIEYLKEILYDIWEVQDDKIKQALELGKRKAKILSNDI